MKIFIINAVYQLFKRLPSIEFSFGLTKGSHGSSGRAEGKLKKTSENLYTAFFVILSGLLLSACNPFGCAKLDSPAMAQSNWAYDPPKTVPDPLYCYKTLGDHMCYNDPIEGADARLAGKNDPYIPPKEKQWWERY